MTGYWIGAAAGMVLHECGHVAAALTLGVRVKRIGVGLKGIYTVREQGSPAANAAISLAGPMVNLLLALVWWHLGDCGWVNLVIGMVNLAPFPNSDGLRVYGLWKGWP